MHHQLNLFNSLDLQIISSNPGLSRPFLKWVGGKRRLIPQFKKYIPKTFKAYYEPFLGGGSVFFHLLPKSAILTDINQCLINTYCAVRDDVNSLIELLWEHQENHQQSPQNYYYKIRAEKMATPLEKAARFIYLNKTCFNGLYRVNNSGEFNVPLGSYKNPKICSTELLISASKQLKNAIIETKPFTHVLDGATAGDFVYFDPPYHPISATSNFTSYSCGGFSEKNQLELRDTFKKLAEKDVKVMLSNSDCPFIKEIYAGFNIHKIWAGRSINSHTDKRGKISEVLITNY
jgi:DNA adenine methylase